MRIRLPVHCLFVLLAVILPGWAEAAVNHGMALTYNHSARANGMGGAGVANVWGGDTNLWANPALLAFRPGVRFTTMDAQVLPDLTAGFGPEEFLMDSQELTLGYAGIGLLYAAAPFDNVYLDMGEQFGTDENGNVLGPFETWQKTQSIGLAVGLTQISDRFFATRLNSWFDVGLGYVWRKYEDQVAEDVLQDAAYNAEATTHDYGWVVRVTPLHTLERFESTADLPVGLVAEATYGWAKTNATDGHFVYDGRQSGSPVPTRYQSGWAVRAAVVPGADFLSGAPQLLRESISPLFAWTYTRQTGVAGYVWQDNNWVYERDDSGERDVTMRGQEFLFLNLFYLRRGNYQGADNPYFLDLFGNGDTTGWGINVQVGRLGGFRYDKATVPLPEWTWTLFSAGQRDVEHESWHVWVDVMAILERY